MYWDTLLLLHSVEAANGRHERPGGAENYRTGPGPSGLTGNSNGANWSSKPR